jgi:hypothetical protein
MVEVNSNRRQRWQEQQARTIAQHTRIMMHSTPITSLRY